MAAGAISTTVDRATYVKQLEAICAPGASATQRVIKGVRQNVTQGKLKRAGSQFASAARIFAGTVKQVKAVPEPAADTATLADWFTQLDLQETYLKKISMALDAGQKVRSQGYEARFVHYGNLANNAVLSFGFDSCRFDATRFG